MIMPDEDILRFIDFDRSGTRFVFGGGITFVISQITRAIDAKKDNLLRRRAGAVIANEPKVIWVKAIKKAFCTSNERFQINKFNVMLEDILADRENHFILDASDVLHSESLFSTNGALNGYGKKQFWLDIDKQIEKFEKKRISLQPVRHLLDAGDGDSGSQRDTTSHRESSEEASELQPGSEHRQRNRFWHTTRRSNISGGTHPVTATSPVDTEDEN